MGDKPKKDVGELMFGNTPKTIRKVCVCMFVGGIVIILVGLAAVYLDLTTSVTPGGRTLIIGIGVLLAGGCTVVAPFLINARNPLGILLVRISAGAILFASVYLAIFVLMRHNFEKVDSVMPMVLFGIGAVAMIKMVNSGTMKAFMDGEAKESLDAIEKARQEAEREKFLARVAEAKAKQEAARQAKEKKNAG